MALSPVDDYVACMVGGPADQPAMPAFDELHDLSPAELRAVALKVLGDDWHDDVLRLPELWGTDSLFPWRISTAAPLPVRESGPVTLTDRRRGPCGEPGPGDGRRHRRPRRR